MMEALQFNWLDVGVIAVILLSALMAFFRGFLREIFSIVAFAGAFAAAIFLHGILTPLMSNFLPATIAVFAAGLAIFVVAFIVISLVTGMVTSLAHRNGDIGLLDRLLGFLFGAVRGALVPLLLIVLGTSVTATDRLPDWLTQARTFPVFTQIADMIRAQGIPGLKPAEAPASEAAPT
jgi:membrane protein required for colicin V production